MMGTTHTVTGVTAGALAAVPLVLIGLDPVPAACFVAVWAVASTLPDIDHPHGRPTRWLGGLTKFIGWVVRLFVSHRGATHTKTGALVFGGVVALVTLPFSSYFWLWGLAVLGGCLTHRWGDMRTKSGLKVNGRTRRIGRVFRTGGTGETLRRIFIYYPSAAAAVLLLAFVITR